MELRFTDLESPIGTLTLVEGERGLCALDFADCEPRMRKLLTRRFGDARLVRDAEGLAHRIAPVREYLAGRVGALAAVEVDTGGTPFQEAVWSALMQVPPGETSTYTEIAREIGRPRAVRAVGSANGSNPVALVIPCHRIVGADGSLSGYAGGLERKRWLLDHEASRQALAGGDPT